MSRREATPDAAAVQAAIAAAVRNGTHGPWRTWCDGCGRQVSGIYHQDNKRRLCFDCSPAHTKPKVSPR